MFGSEEFANKIDVSRETLQRLSIFADLLPKWQSRMNLVADSTLDQIWKRHMLDSAQIIPLIRKYYPELDKPVWLDLGSGAGFPGMVAAIMGAGPVEMVESNTKKCSFLRQVLVQTGTEAKIHNCRIEDMPVKLANIITARALAPLPELLNLAHKFIGPETEFWLLKGQDVEEELTEATIYWNMEVEIHLSLSDPNGRILRVRKVRRKDGKKDN